MILVCFLLFLKSTQPKNSIGYCREKSYDFSRPIQLRVFQTTQNSWPELKTMNFLFLSLIGNRKIYKFLVPTVYHRVC